MPKVTDLIENYLVSPTERTKLCMEHFEKDDVKICLSEARIPLNTNQVADMLTKAYFHTLPTGIYNLLSGVSYVDYCLNEFLEKDIVRCWFEEELHISPIDQVNLLPQRYVIPNTPNPINRFDEMDDCKFVIKNYAFNEYPLDFKAFDHVSMHNIEIKKMETLGGFSTTGINISPGVKESYPGGYLVCLEHFYGDLSADNFIFNMPEMEL